MSDYDKLITPNLNHVKLGNGAEALSNRNNRAEPGPNMGVSPLTIVDDKPALHPATHVQDSMAFTAARGEPSISTKDVNPPIIADREENQAVQKLVTTDSSNAITLSVIGIGLLSVATMLGVRLQRRLQPATVLASSGGLEPVMPMNTASALGVTEMKSQDPNINCSAAMLETRPMHNMNSSRVGWGRQSSQNSRPLTLCYSDMIKGSIVGDDGITAVVPPQDDQLAPPPQTMAQCLQQAQDATVAAIQDGDILMDVEFPPLSADLMEDPNTSAEDLAGANTRLATKYAQNLASTLGKKVAIMYPDVPELERAVEQSGSNAPQPGVSLHSLRAGWGEAESPAQAFFAILGKGKEMVREVPDVDIYVCLTFSAQELPDVEELDTREESKKPIILFNLKLDTQRGDLGLPAFPSKDLQWRFLSRAKAVYYLRTRQYTLSLPTPPFVINYQGAIFRQYPGPFQCLLDTGKTFRPVTTSARRPALGEFKETITQALKFESKGEDSENKGAKFFRTGIKAITWWEEDKQRQELHTDWRE
jgi:hypothetical protein